MQRGFATIAWLAASTAASPLLATIDGLSDLEAGTKCCLCVGDKATGFQTCTTQAERGTSCSIACDFSWASPHMFGEKDLKEQSYQKNRLLTGYQSKIDSAAEYLVEHHEGKVRDPAPHATPLRAPP